MYVCITMKKIIITRALQLSSDRRWFDMARGLWAAGTGGGGGIVARW